MSTALAWLVSRLQTALPPAGGVPSPAGYQQCCEEAVDDLSRRKPLQRQSTLSIVSGTATYDLPSDFMRLASMERVGASGSETLVTSAGLVAFGSDFVEVYTIAGQQITFSPAPAYTATRRIWYAARHVLDSANAYPYLTTDDARLALLKARALACDMKAGALLAGAYSWHIGEVGEDHGGQLRLVQQAAETLTAQYKAALKAAVGPVGTRGRGSVWSGPVTFEDID